jgi:hypothetical protein
MSNRSTSTLTPKALVRRPNGVKDLDPNDPDDNAFVLVIEFVFYCDSPVAAKNSGENGGTHGAQSLFVESLVVSENVSKLLTN